MTLAPGELFLSPQALGPHSELQGSHVTRAIRNSMSGACVSECEANSQIPAPSVTLVFSVMEYEPPVWVVRVKHTPPAELRERGPTPQHPGDPPKGNKIAPKGDAMGWPAGDRADRSLKRATSADMSHVQSYMVQRPGTPSALEVSRRSQKSPKAYFCPTPASTGPRCATSGCPSPHPSPEAAGHTTIMFAERPPKDPLLIPTPCLWKCVSTISV